MKDIEKKTIGDLVKVLKPVQLWGLLAALLGALSGMFWWGCRYSDRANSGKIAALENRLETIMIYDIPSLSAGKLALPSPRKQHEIVELYGELSSAVRSGDRGRILRLYHERYSNKGMTRSDVLALYDPLLGRDVAFEVTALRYEGPDKVAANVICVLSAEKCIDSLDILVRDGGGWRFIN